MFKTTNLSGSSDEDSNDEEIPPISFSNNYDNSFQIECSSSSKSDEEEESEDNDNGVKYNHAKKASKKRSHQSKDEDDDDYDKRSKKKQKSQYVFKDEITKLATSTEKPIQGENKGRSIMERMGYKSGQGLGKNAQGRVEPVELSKQRGRRGLGVNIAGLDPASLHWDSSYEVVDVKEEVTWLKCNNQDELDDDILQSWMTIGPKDMKIEKMTEFCNEKLLQSILRGKEVFDNLSSEELFRARSRCNPFETLKTAIFLNRAALKMANMDSAYNFMFTNPKYENGQPMVLNNQLLYFADVCAGPGGFSEYVLWRKKWLAKGFGFTLKGDCDFKLCDFFAGSPETFEAFYGVKDDGDVFYPDNIRSFTEEVMKGTNDKGVHFMMADGGFSVDGQENYQEILSKQLYLCQFLVALCIVRTEGHFICKLFDIFSPFSAGLVYLMYRSFREISIFKPNTSRPANSERYIICKHKKENCTPIKDYMFEMCEKLWELGSVSKEDITHCVPLSVLQDDEEFYNYLVDSNNRLGERQVVNLMKITAFCRDPNLVEDRQAQMRKLCLAHWGIPDKARTKDRTLPEEAAHKSGFTDQSALAGKTKTLTPDNLNTSFNSLYDWHCVPLGSTELNLYLGLGRNQIFRWIPSRGQWQRETNCYAELSPGTIVYGEFVPELIGEGRSQKKRLALHVVDAVSLGYVNISSLHYKDRLQRMNLFAAALKKHNYKEAWPVRIKQPIPLEDIYEIFEGLSIRYSKSNQRQLILENEEYWFQPKGILFVNTTKEPWSRFLSKRTNYHYYYHPITRESKFDKDRPADANATTTDCIAKQILWLWEAGVGLQEEDRVTGVLHKDDLSMFICNKYNA